MDIVLFILRILIVVALYAFLAVLLWVLLRQQSPGPIGRAPTARLIRLAGAGRESEKGADEADEGATAERAYEVKSAAWIGRDPNCLVHTDDDFASARHAQVLWRAEDAAWWVEDNLSRNGTFVNDSRVTRTILRDGDVIRVGRARFEVRVTSDE